MKRTTISACLLVLSLGISTSASAIKVINLPIGNYELSLANVQLLPQNSGGQIVFQACPQCATTSMTVSTDTAYLVNDSAVTLADFLLAAQTYRQNPTAITNVLVLYDLNTRHVNGIYISHVAQ